MYVYFVVAETNPLTVKIGKSNDPNQRIATLRTSSPVSLNLVVLIRCESSDHACQVESAAHGELAEHNVRGEWFVLNAELQAYIDARCDPTLKLERKRKPGDKAAGERRGRKPKGGRAYSLKLTDAVAEYYRKLGEGNMTLGIERRVASLTTI